MANVLGRVLKIALFLAATSLGINSVSALVLGSPTTVLTSKHPHHHRHRQPQHQRHHQRSRKSVPPLMPSSSSSPTTTDPAAAPFDPLAPIGSIIPLEIWENAKRFGKKPKKKHLRVRKLLRLMGPDFEPSWMSYGSGDPATAASNSNNATTTTAGRQPQPSSPDFPAATTEELGLSKVAQEVADVLESNPRLKTLLEANSADAPSPKELAVDLVTSWVRHRSRCPVSYQWTDLGEFFWPRWIRRGACSGGCSAPVGMSCVPAETRTLQILRWHCRRRLVVAAEDEDEGEGEDGGGAPGDGYGDGDGGDAAAAAEGAGDGYNNNSSKSSSNGGRKRQTKCFWVKVPYPITIGCRCSC